MKKEPKITGQFLLPGTKVCLVDHDTDDKEMGIIIHCWLNEEIQGFDSYIAFFGEKFPRNKPDNLPYILRYATILLDVLPDED